MDRDFEIEIQNQSEITPTYGQLPQNYLSFGELEKDDVHIYIKQDVYKALEELASSDTDKELGSIILGEFFQELGTTYVIISAYIEAKYTDATASTLTFTHETWEYVHSQHSANYRDQKIVGWQHTHPNYGIFLSNYDMFIQENFFNLPFQVAYVIDPIQNLRGFFQWKNGKIEKLSGYCVYDDTGTPIKIEQIKVKKDVPSPTKMPTIGIVLLMLLLFTTFFLSIFSFSLTNKYTVQAENQAMLLAKLADQESVLEQKDQVIEDQSYTISSLQTILTEETSHNTVATTATDLLALLESNHFALQNKNELVSALKAFLENKPENCNVTFRSYTVIAGDTLLNICTANDLDYSANKRIILAINGIINANQIYVGQTILLPVNTE